MNIKHLPVKALKKFELLKFLNFQIRSEFSDRKYNIPIMNNIGMRNLIYNTEPWMKILITKLLKSKNGIFVDVGANIGQTMMKVRSISSVPYIGMEPNPECVVYLEKLIKINQLKDCTICPVGLSNKNGLVTLYSNYAASPYASVIEGFRNHVQWNLNQTHVVPVMRGDDIIPATFPADDIAIVKIDVEGGELEVMEGIENILKTYRPYVVSEILPAYSLDEPNGVFRKARQDRLISFIKRNDYAIFRIDVKNGENSYEPITKMEVGKAPADNYVLVPGERESEFKSTS